jgi:surface polysaccharide O-acyltransferase-like enzyme
MTSFLFFIAVVYLLLLLIKQLESAITELEEWKQHVLLIFAGALMVEMLRNGYLPSPTSF